MAKNIYYIRTRRDKILVDDMGVIVELLGNEILDSFSALDFLCGKYIPLAEAAKKSVTEARRFIAMAQEAQKLYDEEDLEQEDGADAWIQLSDELDAELEKYNVDTKGVCYYAFCPECEASIERETSEDLRGRVMGFQCGECGAAFCERVDGTAEYLRAKTDKIQEAILTILTGDELPMTIRHVFYMLEGNGFVEKTHAGYIKTCSALSIMREWGQVPYEWLADNTRWHIKPKTYDSLDAMLEITEQAYRRSLWNTQPAYVEIWVEKDAIASIISSVTSPYDVPLFVARGFASRTSLYNIAETIKKAGKPAYIYHFGDFDPSGVTAFNAANNTLKEFGAKVELVRVTVTEEQIQEWNLPTRETKKVNEHGRTNKHAAGWGDKPSVEVDVIASSKLRELARACIEKHIDQRELTNIQRVEKAEKQVLHEAFQSIRQNSELVHNFEPVGAL